MPWSYPFLPPLQPLGGLELFELTLHALQAHSWILEDLPDPERWLSATSAAVKIKVTADEASDAMSVVRFKWNWGGVTRRLTNLSNIFNPKPRAAPHPQPTGAEGVAGESGAVRSDPDMRLPPSSSSRRPPRLQTHSVYHVASSPGLFPSRVEKKDKGKKPEALAHPHDSPIRKRQASEQTSNTSSQQTSPTERPFIHHFKSWISALNSRSSERANPQPTQRHQYHHHHTHRTTHSRTPNGSSTPQAKKANHLSRADPSTRRSEEALRFYRSAQNSASALFTEARRASSWGQGDDPIEFADVMSITSTDQLQLNDNDYLFGVGGIEPRSYKPKPTRNSSSGTSGFGNRNSGYGYNSGRERVGLESPASSDSVASGLHFGRGAKLQNGRGTAAGSSRAGPNEADLPQNAESEKLDPIAFDESSSIVSGYGNEEAETKWVSSLSSDEDEDFYEAEEHVTYEDEEYEEDDDHSQDRGSLANGRSQNGSRESSDPMDSFDEAEDDGVMFSPRKRRPVWDGDEGTRTP